MTSRAGITIIAYTITVEINLIGVGYARTIVADVSYVVPVVISRSACAFGAA